MQWFLKKRSASRYKNEINFKKAKIDLKDWKICAHLELKIHYWALKNTVVSISEVHIIIPPLLFLQKSSKKRSIGRKDG